MDYGNSESLPITNIYQWDTTVCDDIEQHVTRCIIENANRLPHTKCKILGKIINKFLLQRFVYVPMLAVVG